MCEQMAIQYTICWWINQFNYQCKLRISTVFILCCSWFSFDVSTDSIIFCMMFSAVISSLLRLLIKRTKVFHSFNYHYTNSQQHAFVTQPNLYCYWSNAFEGIIYNFLSVSYKGDMKAALGVICESQRMLVEEMSLLYNNLKKELAIMWKKDSWQRLIQRKMKIAVI